MNGGYKMKYANKNLIKIIEITNREIKQLKSSIPSIHISQSHQQNNNNNNNNNNRDISLNNKTNNINKPQQQQKQKQVLNQNEIILNEFESFKFKCTNILESTPMSNMIMTMSQLIDSLLSIYKKYKLYIPMDFISIYKKNNNMKSLL